MKSKLYLASKSQARYQLLQEARIPFVVIEQDADESQCDWSLPFEQLVTSIAVYKMHHVCLPQAEEGECIFILTADTLVRDREGLIHGKPVDYADAIKKIKKLRHGAEISSAFCLHKKMYQYSKIHES